MRWVDGRAGLLLLFGFHVLGGRGGRCGAGGAGAVVYDRFGCVVLLSV